MKTYQDLLKVENEEDARIKFVRDVISDYKLSDRYKTGCIAKEYYDHKNVTINEFQKLLYKVTGEVVPDNYSANWKMAHNFLNRFVTQENQHLLGNGPTWSSPDTAKKLGKNFDVELSNAGEAALWGGVAWGFWNLDHLKVFNVKEFAPLQDEEDGAYKAGVRFWQIDSTKPLRAVLYELDGYTEYIWRDGKGEVLHQKRGYIEKHVSTKVDGDQIYDYENYPTFPIVPLWGNKSHQSELVGLREQIDCYDLIKSGFANDVDDASLIYWTIQNADGMDDTDLAKFVERMRTLHATVIDDEGAKAESHSVELHYESKEVLLTRLRADLYEDAMALDTKSLASGGSIVTAVIEAAYKPLDDKCDKYEFCVKDFLDDILSLAGIEDENPTFTRSMISNKSENISNVLQAAQYLGEEYTISKLLNIFGDGDMVEEILKRRNEEDMGRFTSGAEEGEKSEENEEANNSTGEEENE